MPHFPNNLLPWMFVSNYPSGKVNTAKLKLKLVNIDKLHCIRTKSHLTQGNGLCEAGPIPNCMCCFVTVNHLFMIHWLGNKYLSCTSYFDGETAVRRKIGQFLPGPARHSPNSPLLPVKYFVLVRNAPN
jgi:hypothetical protein